ncbi:MAG TPA: SRPBCC family protein [Candidatus Limnocylindrales bacterium]|nr:SRPBCC family protein [Candidatus Limnocylindrales bacterium]
MAVKIEKTFQVQEPVEKVWAILSDPSKVAVCVPGAKITEQVDEKTYKGAISVKVGPSVTDYKGEVQIVRLDAAAHEIEILGKGQDVRGKGSASMKMTGKLRALDDGATEVVSVSELNVVGILAQMGGRMIQEVSNIMFEQFTNNFRQMLQGGEEAGSAAEAKPISAVGLAFSALKASFGGQKSESPEKPKEESGGKP